MQRMCDATLNIISCHLVYGGIPMTDVRLQVQFVTNGLLFQFLLKNITLPNTREFTELHQSQTLIQCTPSEQYVCSVYP
jgi:hypothetical protein